MMRRWVKALGFVLVAGGVGLGTACAADTEDKLLREYAECLTDPHSVPHRTEIANRVGTVPLDSDGMQRWLRGSLERGELSIDEMRATYNRHCT